MRPEYVETVWVEQLQEDWGNVYDKPYIPNSGQARHIIGKWTITSRWEIPSHQGMLMTPMAHFDVELDGGVKGFGRRRTDFDGALDVYTNRETQPRAHHRPRDTRDYPGDA